MVKCPKCGKQMKLENRNRRDHGMTIIDDRTLGGEDVTHVIKEWTCNPCDKNKVTKNGRKERERER